MEGQGANQVRYKLIPFICYDPGPVLNKTPLFDQKRLPLQIVWDIVSHVFVSKP